MSIEKVQCPVVTYHYRLGSFVVLVEDTHHGVAVDAVTNSVGGGDCGGDGDDGGGVNLGGG